MKTDETGREWKEKDQYCCYCSLLPIPTNPCSPAKHWQGVPGPVKMEKIANPSELCKGKLSDISSLLDFHTC